MEQLNEVISQKNTEGSKEVNLAAEGVDNFLSRMAVSKKVRKVDSGFRTELITKLISVRRVSKMTKGGRTLKLSVLVAVGDGSGNFGLGLGKGEDLKQAQDKAVADAKKNMISVKLKGTTIPREIFYKYKAAKLILKPAKRGTGIVAGSSVRLIAEVAGIRDMYSKILGSNNKVTNAYAMCNALKSLS
ncbi:30S ribosomal protein S5 [Candidatus Dojkabacteria bacterium]|uniref:Small ribosomal subunit protein uS5 n=1 Tax=Candidatus Dojkabacteria bacterium TaxID=2099670 RepID=A0A3M0YZJ3_9BACT|nr:MAG: 30S ribosomal protein S5 [Candidatus Dojkabacteria bacterium]